MIQKTCIAAALVICYASPVRRLSAQAPADLKFEVASIHKPCTIQGNELIRNGALIQPPGTLRKCAPLLSFIRGAYLTQTAVRYPDSLEGAPAWINESYEIHGRAKGQASREILQGPMLRTLLEDRFHLRIHRETRKTPGYVLTLAPGGPKMPRTPEGSCIPVDKYNPSAEFVPWDKMCGRPLGRATIDADGLTVGEFADFVSGMTRQPVLDNTELAGRFYFRLNFATDDATPAFHAPSTPGAPSLFTAIQEQLGLKLEPGEVPRVFWVIDHIERPALN